MPVTGHSMAMEVRQGLAHVAAFCECIILDVTPAFGNLEKRAEEIANKEYGRLGSQPVGDYDEGDIESIAEAAHDKGLEFYETMSAVRQSMLNLFAAGLFHLIEQELADLCWGGAFLPEPPNTKLDQLTKWYREHFGLELESVPSWRIISELRLVANAVKHAEGPSAQQLRACRPELFEHPLVREFQPGQAPQPFVNTLHLPLGGEGLYVTQELLQHYGEAARSFMAGIAAYFEAHENDDYPLD